MSVKIDEARRHDAAGRVDAARGRGVPEPPHGSDTSIPDPDVAGKPWIARAVDDVPASDEDVLCGALRTKQMCATRGKCNNHRADEESCSHQTILQG